MIILGLHFGHDAGVSVVKDGVVLSYVFQERHNKVKHAIGLDDKILTLALRDAGVSAEDIDCCAICSTQGVELLSGDLDMKISFRRAPGDSTPCTIYEEIHAGPGGIDRHLQYNLLKTLYGDEFSGSAWKETWAKMLPSHKGRGIEDFTKTGWLDDFLQRPKWERGRTLDELRKSKASLSDENRYGFHLPVTVTLRGRDVPGYYIHHHLAHAASSYYSSPFSKAAVITHDGHADGRSYHSGMFYYGLKNKLYPLAPHHLNIGALYDRVGMHLQLGTTGPAGKLMGLAAYGNPRFFDSRFVGNYYDYKETFGGTDISSAWLYHCAKQADKMGYDMAHYTEAAYATAPINADVAASTQKLFEEVRYKTVQAFYGMLCASDLATPNLCLSGGTALNCPSNSQIFNDSAFSNVYVEPSCDDGGLAIGAALAVYHNLLDYPRTDKPPYENAYLGIRRSTDDLRRALAPYEGRLAYETCENPGRAAAQDVFANKVIGWHQGRSEAGPRALGHRSIVADPRIQENWARVNHIKKRELWRPFAPAVLRDHVRDWFSHAPTHSPYMLFNARVKSGGIPAVTHVDGTARIQTVGPEDGEFHALLDHFHQLSKVPVVMNTSFNGPGEPILESYEDALAFFSQSELDVLYLDQFRVTKV